MNSLVEYGKRPHCNCCKCSHRQPSSSNQGHGRFRLTMSGEKHLYAIHCLDHNSGDRVEAEPRGGSTKRMSNYVAHKDYQMAVANPENPGFIKKISAGPMVEESGKFMIGSFFLVEATREEAQAFLDNDPFSKGNVWETVRLERFVDMVKPTASSL